MDIITTDTIAILAVGVSLAIFIWRMNSTLRADITALGTRLTAVEKETARLSGLLEGLGLSGRTPPSPATGD